MLIDAVEGREVAGGGNITVALEFADNCCKFIFSSPARFILEGTRCDIVGCRRLRNLFSEEKEAVEDILDLCCRKEASEPNVMPCALCLSICARRPANCSKEAVLDDIFR